MQVVEGCEMGLVEVVVVVGGSHFENSWEH